MKTTRLILLAALLFPGMATAADYHVDQQIGKGRLGNISQIAIGADDTVCVLEGNGKVTVFDVDGSVSTAFETGMQNTSAIAVDSDGDFHVFSTLTEEKKVKVGARMRTIQVPIGVECSMFDSTGKELKVTKLAHLKSAKAAQIVGDKLVVADLSARALVFMNKESGKETGRIKNGLRLCCGIFDFCKAPNDTVAVSNLGAFKLQQFDLEGNLVSEFGKRGRGLDDFQGCCNPVSAGYLPDGRILTVEKDPTRIKIYDPTGRNAQQIEGVEELVKGCSFIPVAIDSKGNVYLAANTKGYIVKCVP